MLWTRSAPLAMRDFPEMGIVRYPVRCPGCNVGVLLRLGVGHEKRQGFFYVCPRCQAATRGALIWEGGAHTRLELEDGRQLDTDEECPEVVTINPELPALATTRSMAEPGGSAFITFSGWLGPDGIQQYQSAFYQMRHLIENDWKGLARLTTYYLNRDWDHFDQALEPLLPEEARDVSTVWKRDHHIHCLYELFFDPLWAAHPGKYFLEIKIAWNQLWSPDRAHFNEILAFARAEVPTGAFENTQRDLFAQIGRYVDLMAGMFPGLLCDLLPDEHQPKIDQLRLFRDEYKLLRDMYIQSFETAHKSLRWVLGAVNADARGDPNRFFPPTGMDQKKAARPPRDLDAFSRLTSAEKREWLAIFPAWSDPWDTLFDRHLRNDIGHASARHDLPTGTILRDGRPSLPYTRFVQRVHRVLHALLACTNALKIMRIYSAFEPPNAA